MNKRVEHIDIARGIAILLVILGHSCMSLTGINRILLSFHMPLFIYLSGLFAKGVEKNLRAIGRSIFHKAQRLLLPELLLSCICVAEGFAQWMLKGNDLMSYNPWNDMINWFLPVLWMCSVIYIIVNSISDNNKIVNYGVLLVSLLLSPLAISHSGDYTTIGKFWNLLVKLPVAMFFYVLGSLSKVL